MSISRASLRPSLRSFGQLMPMSLALALAFPSLAHADTAADLAALRQELEAMRASYESRIQALEQRLQKAEGKAEATAGTAPATAATTAAAVPTPVAEPAPAVASNAPVSDVPASAGAFNPALSLILSGLYTGTSRDPAHYAITGFQLPTDTEAGPGTRGFSLAESELGIAANIDPWLRGAANISLHGDDSVSVEEAFVQTTSLDYGFSLKAGRFFSGIGYLNSQHSHTWDFVDNPLVYQALLGTQYGDDGVQLTWVAPLDQYLEFGAEMGRGRSYPGSDSSQNGAGMVALTAHTGGDIGDSNNWRAGLSLLSAKATDQSMVDTDASGNSVTNAFTGSTHVWVADAVWKWAPYGNATRTNFKLQGEYLRSTRKGDLTYDTTGLNTAGDYRAVQSGWYLQGVYQFMPYWRVGLRTEQLDAGSTDFAVNPALFADNGYHPHKNSLMVDFSPSEFSRVRLQFAQDHSREGVSDQQVFLQYQMSLGAHGAHSY